MKQTKKIQFKDESITQELVDAGWPPKEYTVVYFVGNPNKESDTHIEDSTAKHQVMNNGVIDLPELPLGKIANLCIWDRVLTKKERELVAKGEYYHYNQITWQLKLKRMFLKVIYWLKRRKNRLFMME
jgi:hypothetical protein